MQHMQRTWIAAVAIVLVVGSLGVLHAQEATSAEGELLRVDAEGMTFVLQDADGNKQEFAYTAETQVMGAQDGAAGLATSTGQHVVVTYEAAADEAKPPVATTIEVRS